MVAGDHGGPGYDIEGGNVARGPVPVARAKRGPLSDLEVTPAELAQGDPLPANFFQQHSVFQRQNSADLI